MGEEASREDSGGFLNSSLIEKEDEEEAPRDDSSGFLMRISLKSNKKGGGGLQRGF